MTEQEMLKLAEALSQLAKAQEAETTSTKKVSTKTKTTKETITPEEKEELLIAAKIASTWTELQLFTMQIASKRYEDGHEVDFERVDECKLILAQTLTALLQFVGLSKEVIDASVETTNEVIAAHLDKND